MLKKILRYLFTLIGGILGYVLGGWVISNELLSRFGINTSTVISVIFIVLCIILIGLIFYFISPFLNGGIIRSMEYLEKSAQKIPIIDIAFAGGGALIGLIISVLISALIRVESVIFTVISVIVTVIITVLFANICVRKKDEIIHVITSLKKPTSGKESKAKAMGEKSYPKILDTSVIIDGRIFDICQSGFVESTLVIPTFVLDELRHIADSSDSLKRTKGRRGLDILNKIQKELSIKVDIWDGDFKDTKEVDIKLLKLAKLLNGKVITNDYNLNKVAELQGVPVLNINELANAVKPVLLPGEVMRTLVIKDGKESGQGVAYLDDGTMIVIEEGRKYIGETIVVVVTSVLQTAAGRMIFAKPKTD
ncbi:MAG: PIN/TRAM domain-containing protein [Clostridium sp.]|uniref:PIN/TRAM domain-containing protein n=1 Tax=Clostridium sp. TaxID=1506 RepID=UPI003063C177